MATQIPDGTIDNPFLKTFGRPRASWPANASGKGIHLSSSQLIEVTVNGSCATTQAEHARPRAASRPSKLSASYSSPREPNASEEAAAAKHFLGQGQGQAIEDLGWVLDDPAIFLRH